MRCSIILVAFALSAAAVEPVSLGAISNVMLRDKINSLAPTARTEALTTLALHPDLLAHAAELGVSSHGVFCFINCAKRPGPASVVPGARARGAVAGRAPVTLNQVPAYSSRPGSPNTLYLDFNGEIISGTDWEYDGVTSWTALPYNTDGDATTFSDIEQDAIFLIWQRVSEDYRTFNVNVTTVLPSTFGPKVGRTVITRSTDLNDHTCPYGDVAGGVAFVNVFGTPTFATATSPAWVYYDQLSSGQEDVVAEAVSHEIGHNMGLRHDGYPGDEYYPGQNLAGFSWAPIMGNSYDKIMTQWSKGEYTSANNKEDDLFIIGGKLLPTLADDFGNTTGTAATLVLVPGAGSTRTVTPFDGIISSEADSDLFEFSSAAGAVSFTVTPLVVDGNGFVTPQTPGADLDAQADILNTNGLTVGTLTSSPQDNCIATITGNLPIAGTYFLRVRASGNRNAATDGYSAYASIGTYTVTGTTPPIPAGTIGFVGSSIVQYEGNSGPRTITLSITRSEGSGGAVSVQYATSDLGATAGSDYTASAGTLNWTDGGPLTQDITITVDGDTGLVAEDDESFIITLSNPTNGSTLSGNNIFLIVLRNDDGDMAAIAAATEASAQPSGTGDNGGCGGGTLAGLSGLGGLGLMLRRRR